MNTMHESNIRILILGSGGREHSLALQLSKEPTVKTIVVVPGNAGIREPKITSTLNPKLLRPEDNFNELLAWAKYMCINLAIPGDQKYVVGGLGELFIKAGIPWFGPSKGAATIARCPIEANVFMRQYNIPTAECGVYTDYESSKLLLDAMPENLEYEILQKPIDTPLSPMMDIKDSPKMALVMKAMSRTACDEWSLSGICIPTTRKAAHEYAKSFLDVKNTCLMIKQNLQGIRINVTTFTDGLDFYSLPPVVTSNKHPESGSIFGDQGCVASTQGFTLELLDEIDFKILKPTLEGLMKINMPYIGVLSTDIALTVDGPKALGYSAHFNGAVAQALLPLLNRETSLASIIQACIQHRLRDVSCYWEDKISVMVSISAASEGIPVESPRPFKEGSRIYYEKSIRGIPKPGKPKAPTKIIGLQTSPGRVLGVCAFAETLEQAHNAVYELVKQIDFAGIVYERNVGNWELARLSTKTCDLTAKESDHPAQQDGTHNNGGTHGTNQPRILARRGTGRRAVISSNSSFRRFDDSNSNVGRVGTGTSREDRSTAAEGDVCTLGSMLAQPSRPRRRSCPAFPIWSRWERMEKEE